MRLTATYDITEAEFLRACKTASADRRQAAWAGCTVLLVLGSLVIWRFQSTTLGAVDLALGLILLLQLTIGTRRSVKQRMAGLRGPAEVTLTEETVAVRRPGFQAEIAWSAAVRVTETAEFILVFQTAKLFSVVLKRGFTAEQQRELSAFIATLPNRDTSDDLLNAAKAK